MACEIEMEKDRLGITKLGFLPEKCVEMLPVENPFYVLETIAKSLPELNKSSTLEIEVSKLKLFPKRVIKDLNEGEQRRLYVVLAMVIHSLLHGSKARWEILNLNSTESNLVANGNDL